MRRDELLFVVYMLRVWTLAVDSEPRGVKSAFFSVRPLDVQHRARGIRLHARDQRSTRATTNLQPQNAKSHRNKENGTMRTLDAKKPRANRHLYT